MKKSSYSFGGQLSVVWITSLSVAAVALDLRSYGQAAEVMPWDRPGSTLVGNASDPANLRFSANTTFSDQELRDALMLCPAYLLGSHQMAPREEFLELLGKKVRSGYQFGGFPEPRVTVSYDTDTKQVSVQITEGRRFRCGEIKVNGLEAALARELSGRLSEWHVPAPGFDQKPGSAEQKRESTGANFSAGNDEFSLRAHAQLTEPAQPVNPLKPSGDPRKHPLLWVRGKPAHFGEEARGEFELTVKDVLAEHGFFFPKLEIRTEPDPEHGTAGLVVTVKELGPPGILSAILISGNRTNSQEDIQQFLGLSPGMQLTRARLDEAEQKLWRSGRFRDYVLKPMPVEAGEQAASRIRLNLKVTELEDVPSLKAPLSREQEALRKLALWLENNLPKTNADTVVSARANGSNALADGSLKVILSPSRGLFFDLTTPAAKKGPIAFSAVTEKNHFMLMDRQRGLEWSAADSNLMASAFLRLLPDPVNPDKPFNFTMGAGWNHHEPDEGEVVQPWTLDVTLAPAAFVLLAGNSNDSYRFAGDECTVSMSNSVMRFDEKTGRLAEVTGRREGVTLTIQFRPRAFEEEAGKLEALAGALTNRYRAGHAFSTFIAFAGEELAQLELTNGMATNLTALERGQAVRALVRLCSPLVLEPIDRAAAPPAIASDASFNIPADETDKSLSANTLFLIAESVVFKHADEWFPRYSWPWTLARETTFMLASRGEYADAELNRLMKSEDTGPLGYLAMAQGLAWLGSPGAKGVATHGLTHLTTAEFEADCRLLFVGDSALARLFANLAAAVRDLPREELAALAKALPPAEAALLTSSAEALRANPKGDLASTLTPVLNRYWEQALRSHVRSRLLYLISFSSTRL